jgi:hypothetical protein
MIWALPARHRSATVEWNLLKTSKTHLFWWVLLFTF